MVKTRLGAGVEQAETEWGGNLGSLATTKPHSARTLPHPAQRISVLGLRRDGIQDRIEAQAAGDGDACRDPPVALSCWIVSCAHA